MNYLELYSVSFLFLTECILFKLHQIHGGGSRMFTLKSAFEYRTYCSVHTALEIEEGW